MHTQGFLQPADGIPSCERLDLHKRVKFFTQLQEKNTLLERFVTFSPLLVNVSTKTVSKLPAS